MSAPTTTRPAPESRRQPSLRAGRVSVVVRPRRVVVGVGMLAALVALCCVSIGVGQYAIDPLRVLQVLAGAGDDLEQLVVLELRMPRVLTGALVGAALAASGAVTQTVARNPLASPDILGVTGGAGTAAVLVIVLGGTNGLATGPLATLGVPGAALVGGLTSGALIYVLAFRRGVDGYRLVLVGIGVAAVHAALTSWLLVSAELNDATRAAVWLNGSLNGRTWDHVVPVLVGVLVLLPVLAVLAAVLGVMHLGDDVAGGLGVRVERGRLVLLVVAVCLASLATAAAGPVSFVALVAPQVARLLCRAGSPPLLLSAGAGAVLVTGSDLVARTLLAPTELPVGIVTAAVGAPYLLWLITRSRRKAGT